MVKQGEWDFRRWPNLSPRGFYNLIDKAGPTLTHLINVSSLDEILSKGYLEELAFYCPNIQVLGVKRSGDAPLEGERIIRNLKKMKSKY